MQWGTERQTDGRVPIYISCRQRLTWNVIIKFCSKLLLKTKQYSWKIRLPSEWPFSFSTCSAAEPPRISGTGFYTQDGWPSCHPTNSVEASKRTQNTELGKITRWLHPSCRTCERRPGRWFYYAGDISDASTFTAADKCTFSTEIALSLRWTSSRPDPGLDNS